MLGEKTKSEVEDVLNDVQDEIYGAGGSRFPNMTYEQGIEAVLNWLLGNDDSHPYPEF